MSRPREIDGWAEPKTKRGIKLVVVSCSRTGTLGLYQALRILGYRPYHMAEVARPDGSTSHMDVLSQAVIAHNNRFSGYKRYGREEFDKWLADYDAIIELPSYFGTEAIDAYLDDPHVKFLLTERDPDKWVKSFNQFVAVDVMGHFRSPLARLAKFFDPWLLKFVRLNEIMYGTFADNVPFGAPGNKEALRRNYVDYIKLVKNTIPPERLYTIKLEEGLGWEQICPFLEKRIPDEPYPDGRGHKEMIHQVLVPIVNRSIMKMFATIVPIIGATTWFAMFKGPWLMSKLGPNGS